MGKRSKTDNGDEEAKIAIRQWALAQYADKPAVLELFGGDGVMYDAVWKDKCSSHMAFDIKGAERATWLQGDNRILLQKHVNAWDIYDADAYSNPWVVLSDVVRYREPGNFVLIATCSMFRQLRIGVPNAFFRFITKYPFKARCPLICWFYKDFIGLLLKYWESYGVKVHNVKYTYNRFVPSYQTKYYAFKLTKEPVIKGL